MLKAHVQVGGGTDHFVYLDYCMNPAGYLAGRLPQAARGVRAGRRPLVLHLFQ